MNTQTAQADSHLPDVQNTDALTAASLAAAQERLKGERNGRCTCGSGKKYKKCCLRADEDLVRQAAPVQASQAREAPRATPSTIGADLIEQPVPKTRELSETDRKLEQLWEAFDSLQQPSAEDMDTLLQELLALPPTSTTWTDVWHTFIQNHHPDLPAVFHRIAANVPHRRETGMSYFYWAAAEEFMKRGWDTLLHDAIARYRTLDVHCYDIDALEHIQDILLAGRFEAEALDLITHFLPIIAADHDLLPHAIAETANLAFQLRVGTALRIASTTTSSPQLVSEALGRDLGEHIEAELIDRAAQVACDDTDPEWTHAHFNLVTKDIRRSPQAWQDCLRLYDTLLRVAREAWRIDSISPGWAFVALTRLLAAVYHDLERSAKQSNNKKQQPIKPQISHMLACFAPSSIEPRVARNSQDLLGVNAQRARILVDAHTVLLDFASRHGLISADDATATRTELTRLQQQLDTH